MEPIDELPRCEECGCPCVITAPGYPNDVGPLCPVCEPQLFDLYDQWLLDDEDDVIDH